MGLGINVTFFDQVVGRLSASSGATRRGEPRGNAAQHRRSVRPGKFQRPQGAHRGIEFAGCQPRRHRARARHLRRPKSIRMSQVLASGRRRCPASRSEAKQQPGHQRSGARSSLVGLRRSFAGVPMPVFRTGTESVRGRKRVARRQIRLKPDPTGTKLLDPKRRPEAVSKSMCGIRLPPPLKLRRTAVAFGEGG
jgi:hypothetical protein